MSENMVFAPNLARTQEIIVPEQSVDDLLNMMLEKQASNRAQLIRKRVREQGEMIDFNPRTHVHAQIVSIAA
jgi:predicted nucleic acid-binding protein